GLVVLEFRPLLLRELPAGPVIDIGELLIEFPEPGILADCLFVGGTRVAAIEALCAGRGIESGGHQESAQRGGGDMRRQCGAASEARHHSLALRRVVPAFHKHQHRIARNPMYLSTNEIGRHTSELQSLAYLVCRLLLEKKKTKKSLSE